MSNALELSAALLDATSLTEDELEVALRRQEESGQRLTEVLLELGLVPEPKLRGLLGGLYGIPVRDALRADEVDGELATQPPISFAKQHHLLPIRREGDRLEIAISDPLLTDPLDDLQLLFPGVSCEPVLCSRRAILNCINQVFDRASSAEEVRGELGDTELADVASELIEEPKTCWTRARRVPLSSGS